MSIVSIMDDEGVEIFYEHQSWWYESDDVISTWVQGEIWSFRIIEDMWVERIETENAPGDDFVVEEYPNDNDLVEDEEVAESEPLVFQRDGVIYVLDESGTCICGREDSENVDIGRWEKLATDEGEIIFIYVNGETIIF